MQPNTRNILAVYAQASEEQIQAGLAWYAEANALARELDPDSPKRAAGVIAALSPLVQWERNVKLARDAYANGEASGTLPLSVAKANAILAGADPLDVLTSPKIRAFYLAIADPESGDSVVIDRHAFDIAVGRKTDDRTRGMLKRKGLYAAFQRAYARAARQLGIPPASLQAITWLVWRGLYAERLSDKY